MLNHITVMGRIGTDIELRKTGSGVSVASFTVACDRDFKSGGEKETDWIECVAWRQTADFINSYFAKGRVIVVSGRLQVRPWEDKEGKKRKTYEVVVENAYFGDSKTNAPAPASQFAMLDDNDAQLPF